ncbi:MAG TPA: glycosyltransferase family 9 protein [Chitinivibrionales bacterium]|nr:glycosyltransferase family 9 protein [Chitinivibrionales bacterium]
MNILIIRLSSMGDVILATSVFSYLKRELPVSKIWFVTQEKYAELFSYDTRLARVVPVQKGAEKAAARELAGVEWNRIIDLQNSPKSRMLRKGLLSRQPAAAFQKLHGRRLALLWAGINLYRHGDHVVARYAKAAGFSKRDGAPFPSAGIILDKKKCEAVRKSASGSAMVRPMIALFPFSAWKNKEWPTANYAFVGRYFSIKGWGVMIAGGPQDVAAAEALKRRIGGQCLSTAGALSLYETACLVSICKLALGNDTGLCHLARACGVKTGVIYGPTTAHFGFFPYGDPPFRVFEARHFCRPCHAHGGNICYTGSRRCMTKIRPEMVIKGLEELHNDGKS